MMVNRDAHFHLSFALIGAVMDGCSSWFLTRTIGGRTASLALTGGNSGAEQALAWGLVHQVVDNEKLWDTASQEMCPARRTTQRTLLSASRACNVSSNFCRISIESPFRAFGRFMVKIGNAVFCFVE